MDWPDWILATAIRRMPGERGEWGAAMRAELSHIQHPRNRWQFALGCVRVALFPPRRGGFFMKDQMKYWLKTMGVAALFSLLFTGAFWSLGIWSNPNIPSEMQSEGQSLIGQVLFNWLVLTLVFTPIVSGLRDGENISMKDRLFPLAAAVFFGLLLIAPFAFMEYWNNPVIRSGEIRFPFLLFFALWLPPTIFFLGATPIVRKVSAGQSILERPLVLLLRVLFLLFFALIWVRMILNEMPCFLGGVPGCD